MLITDLTMAKVLGGSGDEGKTNPEVRLCTQPVTNKHFPSTIQTRHPSAFTPLPNPPKLTITLSPQELFAAGYGACFQSAMNASAMTMKMHLPAESIVETTVYLLGDLKALDLGLRVNMKVYVPKELGREKMEKIVAKAKEVCPYSRATKGNVDTNIELVED